MALEERMNAGAQLMNGTEVGGLGLKQVIRLALPMDAVAPVEAAFLARRVTGVRVLPADPAALPEGAGGELWLCDPQTLSGQGGLDVLMARAAASEVAAVAVVGEAVLPPAGSLAPGWLAGGPPLLRLPPGTRLETVAQGVGLLLAKAELQMERRGACLYQALARLSTENRGLGVIVQRMAGWTGKTVALYGNNGGNSGGNQGEQGKQDQQLVPLQHLVAETLEAHWEAVQAVLRDPAHLPERMLELLRWNGWHGAPPPAELQALPVPGLARYVTPVLVGQRVQGWLSVVGQATELDALDALVVQYGAPVCALEMAKARAVREAEKRMQGDFMDELLAGRLSRQEALYRAQRLGLDERAPHVSLALAWEEGVRLSPRELEAVVRHVVARRRLTARVLLRGERVLILLGAPELDPIDYAFSLARRVALEAARQYPDVQVATGIGRPVKEIVDWPASYQDANWACTVAQRLASGTPLFFGDLGVYRLLAQLEGGQELPAFCERVLGSLMAYDRRHNAELIETLEAYFACNGNASQTAQRLHIHRNTLLYRMTRIADLSTIDLENEESRLAAQVALKVRRLLSSESREGAAGTG